MDLLLHDIPEAVNRALRERADVVGTSVDAVAVDALARGLNVLPPGPPYQDLDWFFGGGCMDEATLAAIADLDQAHPEQDHKVNEIIAADAALTPVHEP